MTDADGNTSTVLMDDNGQVCETIDALGNVTHYTYDVSGDLTAVNGPQGSNYVYTYDGNGNLTSATDPLGLTTQFTYNANNDLTSYTDAKGNTTTLRLRRQQRSAVDHLRQWHQEQFNNYNPLGEAAQFVNANGQAVNLPIQLPGPGDEGNLRGRLVLFLHLRRSWQHADGGQQRQRHDHVPIPGQRQSRSAHRRCSIPTGSS